MVLGVASGSLQLQRAASNKHEHRRCPTQEAVLSQRHDDMKAFCCSRDGAGCSVIGTTLLVTMAASLCRCSASLRPPEGAAVCCWRHRGPNTEDRWRQRCALEPLDPRTDEIETTDIRVPLSKALKRVNMCYSKAASVNQ